MALTAEERRALALAEVYQHRPGGEQVLLTLEFNHPSFDVPARVVADNTPLEARLETGEVVQFEDVTFSAVGPGVGDGRWPEIELALNVVGGDLEALLERSLRTPEPVSMIAREYVRSLAFEGPSRVIFDLELDRTRTTDLSITGTAGFFGLDRTFGYTYDPTRYPGLG